MADMMMKEFIFINSSIASTMPNDDDNGFCFKKFYEL